MCLINVRIKELRIAKKMSRIDFAAHIGIDNSQYGKIENGKLSLTLDHVMEICSKFNVSSEWLLFGRGEKYVVKSKSDDQGYKEKYIMLLEEKDELNGKYSAALEELRAFEREKNIPVGTDSDVPDAKPATGT